MIHWSCKEFTDLTHDELYALLRLRSEVFVMEQHCIFLDLDGKDQAARHLMGWDGLKLAAYCRILPPGISYEDASIGRVSTPLPYRGTGTGRALMEQAIGIARKAFHNLPIRISAQAYLIPFYSSLGFEQVSNIYMEDDMEHAEMLLR
jgi:ElaA protein